MIITHAKIVTREGEFRDGWVETDGEMLSAVHFGSSPSQGGLDAQGWILCPGWIDLQINGGFGFDFTADPTRVWEVGSKLVRYGVTDFLPTLLSAPKKVYAQAIEVYRQGPPEGWRGARPLGWHFEGPFLNPDKRGAHNLGALRSPDPDFAQDWSRENGVCMVTMAPELPGALDLARQLASRGVILSAGHSMATRNEAELALEAGYTSATHLYNAMPPLNHRNPGLSAKVLLDQRFSAGLISDGIHVHPDMLDLAWRLKGADGIALVTDAVGMLGLPPGSFVQGGMEVIVDDRAARLPDGTLAGSILSLDKALRNMVEFTGMSIGQILPALSRTQSRLLHLDQNGEVAPGFRADLTLVDRGGHVMMTIVDGKVVYSAG